MDGSNPGSGGGGGYEMDDDGRCEVCAMWRDLANHKSDGGKQLLVVASDGCSDSLKVGGHEKSSSCPQATSGIFGAAPPCAHHLLNEHVVPDPEHFHTSNDIVYTTLPGCCLTKAQDEKVQEIARSKKPDIPLHVAAMNKRNHIPLQLALGHFKDRKTKSTIQLEAPDKKIYSVGASKLNDDQIVLDSEWNSFVASHHIQEKDLLIFRSTENSRLEVLIIDPSGHEKTSSSFVMGNSSSTKETSGDSVHSVDPLPHAAENSSSTKEMSGDSVHIVDPPPHEVIELSSSDDDDIVRKGTRESCRVQKWVTRSSAKAQKMNSTSSPSTESGYEDRKPHHQAPANLGVVSEPRSTNLGGASQQSYILARGATLALQVERKVEEKVHAIRSELPIYVKVMTTSNVYRIGMMPCIIAFCAEYASAARLPGMKQALILQMEGKTKLWDATLCVLSNNVRRIHKGWKEFALQNGLEVDDICLFKLADGDTKSLKMMVYVIRKSEIEL
ncbi:B3 domain-containing protein Os03g0620500 isoform X2 [Lolium perenne]|uniref:B3 domain-containing protein Os03g0620500 isoform X2 n=1 Tax=Lolium perenne TaxID=4522 RepID=UPI0021F5C400|nr:B3 domain-containing protein Os03g0620500-like isoform X2 [Lolium perenne]